MDKPTRKHEIEVALDVTPEQAWEAVTEADKLTAWFAPEVRVTPGVGGSITMSWGMGMEATAPISIWEPGKRVGWIEGEGSEYPKTIEFQVEAKAGGTSVVRLVHSGFGEGASFDAEFDSVYGGWHTFLAMLRYGAPRFARAKSLTVSQLQIGVEPKTATWERMCRLMGITSLAEGSEYTASIGDIPLKGRVLRQVKAGYLCLSVESLEDSLLALFVEGGKKAMVTAEWVLYGDATRLAEQVRGTIEPFVQKLCNGDSAAAPKE